MSNSINIKLNDILNRLATQPRARKKICEELIEYKIEFIF